MREPLLLRSFLDTFAESACLLGETGDVRGMNAAAERLLGYKEDELLGGPFHPRREIMRDDGPSGDGDVYGGRLALDASVGQRPFAARMEV